MRRGIPRFGFRSWRPTATRHDDPDPGPGWRARPPSVSSPGSDRSVSMQSIRPGRSAPRGSGTACRLLQAREQRSGLGETGVEVGPVSGDVELITFNVNMAALAQTERGREAQLWVDGLNVGRISNMRIPWSLAINQFGAGIHSYRMELALYDEEGILQFSRSGSVVGHGPHRGAGGRLLHGGLDPGITSRPGQDLRTLAACNSPPGGPPHPEPREPAAPAYRV